MTLALVALPFAGLHNSNNNTTDVNIFDPLNNLVFNVNSGDN